MAHTAITSSVSLQASNLVDTEMKYYHFDKNFYHWLHRKLFFWQLTVQAKNVSSKWHFCYKILKSTEINSGEFIVHCKHRCNMDTLFTHTGLHFINIHDDVIKWKHFPHYWPFVRGIHRSPVNSPHKGQWRGALMFSLICVWINDWVNNREAGDLRRYRAHYDVIVMFHTLKHQRRLWYRMC